MRSKSPLFAARFWFSLVVLPLVASAQPFLLPTANHFLFAPGGEEKFFVGTVGKTWVSGTFGCVRTEGWQLHEGLDIRCLERDRQGEPIDPVLATADGTVVYLNKRSALSTYGNYVVLRHQIEGLEVYSLYAHLRAIEPGLSAGREVKAGARIATMGRTSNTRQSISKDRAHVHFELALLLNDRFAGWFKKNNPRERNDHGDWNGQNLAGLDPRAVFLEQRAKGGQFSLLQFLRGQTELCRVLVRDTNFPWLKRYGALVVPNPSAQTEGIAGYELAINYAGLPFQLIPRSAREIKSASRFQLLAVNEAEYGRNPCRRIVVRRGTRWELGPRGEQWLDLLTY